MKGLLKGIFVLALLGGAGYIAYHFVFGGKAERACKRVAALCGSKGLSKRALKKCERVFSKLENFSKLEKAGGKQNVERAEACIAKSESCASAMGCVVGAALGTAGDFLEGVRKSLKK